MKKEEATKLSARRKEILAEMEGIQRMRKGVLSATFQKVAHKNGEVAIKGPYYILSRKGKGNKTVSKTIPAKDAPRVQQDVDNYKQFRQLTDEYVDVCEQLSLLEEDEGAKKN